MENKIDLNELLKDCTAEDLLELKKKFDEAENDTTPYAIVDEDDKETIKVVGDVNKTKIEKHTYHIQFGYRNTPANRERFKDEEIIGESENYLGIERHYEDAWIPPRKFSTVQAILIQLYKFLNAVTEDGQVRDLTPDEALAALGEMGEEICDTMNMVVATVLGIPEEDAQYILLPSAVAAIWKFAEDFPEVINGVDFTIDKLSERK